MTAIFSRRTDPTRSVVLLDGAKTPGAKILVSGGSRCNVTNAAVTDRDFWGGPRSIVRRMLRAFTADDAVAFFQAIGVSLHEEANGKLFPDSNRARDVLDALLRELNTRGAVLLAGHRVEDVVAEADGFRIITSQRRAARSARGARHRRTSRSRKAEATARASRSPGGSATPSCRLTPALTPLLLAEQDELHRSALRRRARRGAVDLDRRRTTASHRGCDALDPFRRQRSGGARRVAALAARRGERADARADRELLRRCHLRGHRSPRGPSWREPDRRRRCMQILGGVVPASACARVAAHSGPRRFDAARPFRARRSPYSSPTPLSSGRFPWSAPADTPPLKRLPAASA